MIVASHKDTYGLHSCAHIADNGLLHRGVATEQKASAGPAEEELLVAAEERQAKF
jgi:hypothetical protein